MAPQARAGDENVAPRRHHGLAKPKRAASLTSVQGMLSPGAGGFRRVVKTGHRRCRFHGQFTGSDHGGDRGAQAGIIHPQVVLQFAQRHGAALDGGGKDIFVRGVMLLPLIYVAPVVRQALFLFGQ